MNLHRMLLASALALLAGHATAQSSSPANRIVGLWQANVTIAPCAGGPARTFTGYNTYHLGGTLSDTNSTPPATRGPGQGLWEYQGHDQYTSRFQFNRYLPDGSFDGISDIRTWVVLNAGGDQASQTIYARNLNPDGSLRVELCGNASGERIGIN